MAKSSSAPAMAGIDAITRPAAAVVEMAAFKKSRRPLLEAWRASDVRGDVNIVNASTCSTAAHTTSTIANVLVVDSWNIVLFCIGGGDDIYVKTARLVDVMDTVDDQ